MLMLKVVVAHYAVKRKRRVGHVNVFISSRLLVLVVIQLSEIDEKW